jgi:hypothetical protein
VESFAGGYFFDLAELAEGDEVLDPGSGSGMEVYLLLAEWERLVASSE